jgi:glycosyltransferase involved in cell wall biosynthesis
MDLLIALIRREYITHLDGINRFIAWLAEGLVKLGHEVFLTSWCYSGGVRGDELSSWFKQIHGLDVEVPVYTLEEEPCKGDPWVKMMYKWWLEGSRLLAVKEADVALVNGALPLRFKPKVAVAHGPILNWSLSRRMIQRILYSTFDKIVCVSEETRRQCSEAGILNCDMIIPLPIKLDLYKPLDLSQRRDIVVHVGTRPVKNPDISIKVVEELRRRGLSVELVIIGPRTRETERLVKEKDFVEAFFEISEKEKISILCSAKAYLLPSSAETFSLSTLEAMACGTPVVVSSAVPGEVVVNGYNGVVVSGLNYLDYADALERILRDEDLWVNMSRNELNHVNKFNYINIAKKYEELLNELIKQ